MTITIAKHIVAFALILPLSFTVAGCGKKTEQPKAVTAAPKTEVAPTAAPKMETGESPAQASAPVLSKPITEEKTLFSFENGNDGFEIPSWAEETPDIVGKSVTLSKSYASNGKQSLCLVADFPGKIWTSALIELEQYIDLNPYRQIAVDVYLPENAPLGLKAKIILTIGEDWTWTEMVRNVPLEPGKWVTIAASLEDGSLDWKRAEVNAAFRQDIRKIVVRVESNKRPEYSGPVYIDNIRVGK
ncbi:MAG: hypothetical protein PHS37_03325 [Candidatus Omnitrophica bacterium]|nr:hypothetical protein [Candidatus Omnitrophota bacterium]